MKSNHYKSNKAKVMQAMNALFEQNGKKEIPDVKEVCTVAQTSPQTTLKYMYEWWDAYQDSDKESLLQHTPEFNSSKKDSLKKVSLDIECLLKEVELHGESLNYLPELNFPLGNYICDTLQVINNKLLVCVAVTADDEVEQLQEKLKEVQTEYASLAREVAEDRKTYAKKILKMREDCNEKNRELTAARLLIKSLKQEWRNSNQKKLYYYNNFYPF